MKYNLYNYVAESKAIGFGRGIPFKKIDIPILKLIQVQIRFQYPFDNFAIYNNLFG